MKLRIVLSVLFALALAACALEGIGTSPSEPYDLPELLLSSEAEALDGGVDAE